MKIAVCMKSVPDPSTVEVNHLTGKIKESRLIYTTNPADETALEFALRLRSEKDQLLVVSVGPSHSDAGLHNALALGAHSVVRIWDDSWSETYPWRTSSAIRNYMDKSYAPDLIFCGSYSTDRSTGSVPTLLAEMLGYAIVVSVTDLIKTPQIIRVKRRINRGMREVVEVELPAVVSIESSVLQLREASLPAWMASHRQPVPALQIADLGGGTLDKVPSKLKRLGIYPKRMPPRPIFTPDSSLPPEQRIDQILSAGIQKKAGRVFTGTHREAAAEIYSFLRQRGFLNA